MYYGFSQVGPMTKEAEEKCQAKKFSYYNIENTIKYLTGQVLTIIEAVIQDQEQRKATKDIVKKYFSSAIEDIYDEAVNRGDGECSSITSDEVSSSRN